MSCLRLSILQVEGEEEELVKKKAAKNKNKLQKFKSTDAGPQEIDVEPTDDREALLMQMFNLGYREIFFKCDARHGRTLDDEEFSRLPAVLELSLDDDQVDMIRKEMDVHKHGVVEWVEWLNWWRGDSPGWKMLKEAKEEALKEREAAKVKRRERTIEEGKKQAEQTVEYWTEDDGEAKLNKFKSRRVEIAGRGRGTVIDAKKKGLLIAFDGHPAGWTGAVCGYEAEEGEGVLAPAIEEDIEPFEEMIKATELKKIPWKLLKERPVIAFADEQVRKFDEEEAARALKESDRQKATLRQLALEWKKAYKSEKKKSAFGLITEQVGLKKVGKKQSSEDVEQEDPDDITADCKEQFLHLDEDSSGTLDAAELMKISDWFQELKLVDELGVEIPQTLYPDAYAGILDGRVTVDFDEFMEWFEDTEEKPMSEFASAVKGSLVQRKQELRSAQAKMAQEDEDEDDLSDDDDDGRRGRGKKKKKKKKSLNKRKGDPRDQTFWILFGWLDEENTGRITRPMLNKLCSLIKMDHMLGRELDKLFKTILESDKQKLGYIDRFIWADWCASDTPEAIKVATSVVRVVEMDRAEVVYKSMLEEGMTTLSTDNLTKLADLMAEAGVKLRKRELDEIVALIDADGDGELDAEEWKTFLLSPPPEGEEIARKVRSAGRIRERIKKAFVAIDVDSNNEITREEWENLTPEHFRAMSSRYKLSKGDIEKARKELDLTKTKPATLPKFENWTVSGENKIGSKLYNQMSKAVLDALDYERAVEQRWNDAQNAAMEEDMAEAAELATQNWDCDLGQFTKWINDPTSEIAQLVNHAAAELAWPEEELVDLAPELTDQVIKNLWAELDWEDDRKITLGHLKQFRMLINYSPTKTDMESYEEELELNEFGLFGYDQFAKWVNGDTAAALRVRKHVHTGKRGSDAAERGAKALADMSSGGVKGLYTGSKALGKGTLQATKAFKQGATPVLHATGKGLFGVTKVTLTATARIGGVGGIVLERVEKSMMVRVHLLTCRPGLSFSSLPSR
eukprot:COSAG05_NODE_366_length_10761_cov_3.491465_7_plen_1023_part_00